MRRPDIELLYQVDQPRFCLQGFGMRIDKPFVSWWDPTFEF